MSVITDTWRQLVRRRLWPVALLLLGALVAVPVLLAHDPQVTPAAAAPAPAQDAKDGLAEPVVSLASTGAATSGRRHVIGARKDPFEPALPKKPKHATTGSDATVAQTSTSGSTASGSRASSGANGGTGVIAPTGPSGGFTGPSTPTPGGSSTPPVSSPPPSSPPASGPPAPKPPAPYTVKLRFGDASGSDLPALTVKPLDPVPDADSPVAVYAGRGPDKRSVAFLVDASVTPSGDGTCEPYPEECEHIVMRKGDTEFFDVKDPATGTVTQTYELDVVDIALPAKASASRSHAARVLKAELSRSPARVARTAGRVARVVAVLQPSL